MATYRFTAFGRHVEDRQDCPTGHVRLCFRSGQDNAPRDITEALLSVDEDKTIGPYPAKLGSHWSDQPHGQAGYYILVGPVPEADLTAELRDAVATMDAMDEFDREIA